MTCPSCGRWSPADRETGYDADDLCPDCQERDDANNGYFDFAVQITRAHAADLATDDDTEGPF